MRVRAHAVPVAFAAGLVLAVLLLPGGGVWTNRGVGSGAGTPAAIVFQGIVFGGLNALMAAGLVLIYRASRVVNFAQGALGVVGATFAFTTIGLNGWPYWLAVPAGIALAAGLGALIEVGVLRRFFTASRVALTVLTVALGSMLAAATGLILVLPIFPPDAEPIDLAVRITVPFEGFTFGVGDLPLPFGAGHLIALGAAALALITLGAFLTRTRLGAVVRASSENPERAEQLGISVRSVSTLVWAIAGALSATAIVLTSTAEGAVSSVGFAPAALLPALAAAIAGRLERVGVAAAAAVGITVAQEALGWSYPGADGAVSVLLFAAIVAGLILQRRRLGRMAAEGGSWEAVEEPGPVPAGIASTAAFRGVRWAIAIAVVSVVGLLPWIAPVDTVFLAGFVAITGITLLSIVVLTGWAGQVSLGQVAFVAIGAVVAGALTGRLGVPFWAAILIAAIVTGVVATIVGLPALRVRGLMLAVATFAFAFVVEHVLFDEAVFGWLLPPPLERPRLFLFDLEDERTMYYVAVGVFALAAAIVARMRRSRIGRILIAARENPQNLDAFGVRASDAKLLAFGIAGALCGVSGAMLAFHQREVIQASFTAAESLDVFLLAVVGGVGTVLGAVMGTAYSASLQVVADETLRFLAGPAGAVLILYAIPGGLASVVFAGRDSLVRVLAHQRGQAADGRRDGRAPLAPPSPHAGVAVIDDADRYAASSDLFDPARARRRAAASVDEGVDAAAATIAGVEGE